MPSPISHSPILNHSSNKQIEIELKFSIQSSSIELVQKHLKTLENQGITINALPVQHLSNTYYETTDNQLRRHDMGLRVRGFNHHFEMTLKTASKGPTGLQQRDEYNIHLPSERLAIHLFEIGTWPEAWDINGLQTRLYPLFKTDFQRSPWLVTLDQDTASHTEIELVIDQGFVLSGKDSESIEEIEIELKKGELSVFFAFATELVKMGGLRLSDLSKAARGYLLAGKASSNKTNRDDTNTKTEGSSLIKHALKDIFFCEDQLFRGSKTHSVHEHQGSHHEDTCTYLSQINQNIMVIGEQHIKSEIAQETECLPYVDKIETLYSSDYNQFKLNIIKSISMR